MSEMRSISDHDQKSLIFDEPVYNLLAACCQFPEIAWQFLIARRVKPRLSKIEDFWILAEG